MKKAGPRAAGPRGVAVKGEEGYAAAGRHGAVAKGDEGYAAVGPPRRRRGRARKATDVSGRAARWSRAKRAFLPLAARGVVVGHRYESYEAWKVVAGVGAAIAVGTMLAKPPKAAAPVSSGGSTYYYDNGTYYTRVISDGATVYQVVEPPAGVVIATLPAGCSPVNAGGVAYSKCGSTHYQKVSAGYQVVVLQ